SVPLSRSPFPCTTLFRSHCVVWLGSVAAVLILVAGFVIWRLMQGPIALDWLAPYIEAGLERSGIGFKVAIGGVRLGIDRATHHQIGRAHLSTAVTVATRL